MNVQFLASRTITRYMVRMFMVRFASVLAALVIILMALDLLGESGKILAWPGNGEAEIWHYISLRTPQIVARFLPFSALLATLITLATLNQHSEVIAMKAAGVSAHQILAPLVLASIAIAGVSFWFNDRIVTRANATLTAWQDADYGPVTKSTEVKSNVWVRFGDDLIRAGSVSGRQKDTKLSDVSLFDREGGRLRVIITAPRATQAAGGGWMLHDARLFDVRSGKRATRPEVLVGVGITPDRFTLSDVNADQLSFGALRSAIHDLKEAGRPTDSLESGLWHKISAPLSAILMPLLAAWAPFVLFLFIGEMVLIRTEE